VVAWEKGEAQPSNIYIEKICLIYNVSEKWLRTGEGDKKPKLGKPMTLSQVKAFLKRHPDLEEQKPGLYQLLEEADWREEFKVREEEAEYLSQIELIGRGGPATPSMWARELELYRSGQQEPATDLTEEERQVLQYMRSMEDEDRKMARDIMKRIASKGKKKP
jgi:hypothetical protein